MRLFTSTIKALTYTYGPAGLAHFAHSASIVWSLARGRGTSVRNGHVCITYLYIHVVVDYLGIRIGQTYEWTHI